jgi:hypothetical protein
MAKKNNFPKVFVVAGALFIGTLIYVFGFTSITSKVMSGKADKAILSGRIEISSPRDFDKYFVFLPADEVIALLSESGDKFLFPQIDLGITTGQDFVVQEKEVKLIGDVNPTNFMLVSGLPQGTKIYSSAGELVRGWVIPGDGASYAWVKEAIFGSEKGVMLSYFPAIDFGTAESNPFIESIESEAYSYIPFGDYYAEISIPETIPEGFIPGGVSLATAIAEDGEVFTALSLDKILTYKGRIVMVEK